MNSNKTFIKNICSIVLGILITSGVLFSCKKDAPAEEVKEIPGFPVNTTISKLVENAENGKTIESEAVVWGFVVGSGAGQNANSMVWIQDDESGLAIKVAEEDLSKYEEGTLVFVKAKGLTIKREGSFLVMGTLEAGAIKALSGQNLKDRIGLGAKNQSIPVDAMGIAEIATKHNQRLISLKDVEVINEDIDGNFGPSDSQDSKVIVLQDCGGNEVYVVTDKRSAVAAKEIKDGRGNIKGLLTVNNGRKELRLLHENDGEGLTGIRCAGSGDISLTRVIAGIRSLNPGSVIATGTVLKVVNISSGVSETVGITVQDASSGIFISGLNTQNYPLGAALIINVAGKTVATVNGRLAITGVTGADVQNAGSYQYPEKIVTVASMITENVSENLVQLNNMQVFLYDALTTEKVYRIRDNSGKINLKVANASSINIADGTASVKGYFAVQNGEPVFKIRQQSDIVYGGTAPAKDPDYILETFETASVKGLYPLGNVTAPSGVWVFDGALLYGLEPKDWRPMSPRLVGVNNRDAAIPGPGFIQNKFDINGLKRIKVEFVSHNDPADIGPVFRVEVKISTDNGASWTSLGTKDTGKSVIATADFSPNIPADKKVLVQIINQSPQPPGIVTQLFRGNRINILKVILEQK
jgi:hypothetical protein